MIPVVDVGFPVRGTSIARDHGCAVYGALSRAVPALHGAPWLGVHPLAGIAIARNVSAV
jgi:hypothetical protein